ncbi:MAG: hypothetical protein OEV25_16260 [Deltaproteobacteria bacterium]|nr:hypothetical protein [Deltaproteobacteria bacterium]
MKLIVIRRCDNQGELFSRLKWFWATDKRSVRTDVYSFALLEALRGNHCSRPCGYGSEALSFLKLGHNRTSLIGVLFPSPAYAVFFEELTVNDLMDSL